MVTNDSLEASRQIHRRTGKTFYYATRLFPERIRHKTYVLYAFFRIADEVVDDEDNDLSPAEQRDRLERFREAALGRRETDDPVLQAFDDVRRETDVTEDDVDLFVDAMATDIEKHRYETYDELEAYMRGSASAVGYMMTGIMDVEDPDVARPHARALGEAFQLSNFLRDVREDVVDRDRIYLPRETLDQYGVTESEIENLEMSDGFRSAMIHEMARAEKLYREGVAGIKYLPEDCQFAVLLAAVLYADHHRLIRERDYDVLSETPDLSTTRKLWLIAKTRWHWHWNKDPEAVFERVSTIGDAPSPAPGPEPPEWTPTQ
ncbi:geranylgeranyl-diphosphate geranylgeranyltransferase [Halorientalis sp. IM1011]|uniref:phytoene/squalene synthase family protein n=1 Tax=Halorientalis sp. IM1011 TaxID=1932360 RepID=UPI00097CC5CC|nr:phytoene/squalene synthase family protein [Halorientalis sp. IM1011]AQL43601.1 geranylgeranyl-diphosphate geranylgeranyltransferase [Halorientalis sp. IM1011]